MLIEFKIKEQLNSDDALFLLSLIEDKIKIENPECYYLQVKSIDSFISANINDNEFSLLFLIDGEIHIKKFNSHLEREEFIKTISVK